MGEGARVENIDAINDFRIALMKFTETAGAALGDAETDVTRTLMWLDGEQQAYWVQQIRSRQEALAKAQEAYRQKKIFKDSTGSTPSAIEEQKMVTNCQRRLAEAEEKLMKLRRYVKQLQKEALLYKGQVQRFSTAVASDVPNAISHLGALLDRLSEYAALGPAGAAGGMDESMSRYFGVPVGTSMSRGDGVPARPADYARLRTQIPSDQQRADAPVAPLIAFAVGGLPVAQVPLLDALPNKQQEPEPGERVTVTTSALAASQIFLVRVIGADGGSAWHIGPVDAQADRAAITATTVDQLLAQRPDWRSLLSLAPGSLAVIGGSGGGVVALLNGADQNILPEAPQSDAAPPTTA